eukprot:1399829-Pyramimonas_sp.AAC.1
MPRRASPAWRDGEIRLRGQAGAERGEAGSIRNHQGGDARRARQGHGAGPGEAAQACGRRQHSTRG